MKLSKKEKIAYDYMRANIGREVPLEELTVHLQGYADQRFRGTTAATMRVVVLKSQTIEGLWPIKRTSALGRGNTAVYQMLRPHDAKIDRAQERLQKAQG